MSGHAFRDWIERLKGLADARRVADALPLQGRGKRWYCPNCQPCGGKTPDLAVGERGFKCFKCGTCGDVIGLVELATGWGFPETMEWLARFCGVSPYESGGRMSFRTLESLPPARSATKPSEWVSETIQRMAVQIGQERRSTILEAFLSRCAAPSGDVLRELADRGIAESVLDKLQVRFCGLEYMEIMSDLRSRFGRAELLEAGLLKPGQRRPVVEAFWRYHAERLTFLVFPYFRDGRVVYLKARALADKGVLEAKGLPRFLNAGGAVPCPYNADDLNDPNASVILICEGETDTLTALSRGFRAVGIPGWGGFKRQWVERFRGKIVYLVLDSDSAGRRGVEDIAAKFVWAGLNMPSKIELPGGMDLNDYFRPPDQRAIEGLLDRIAEQGLTFDGQPLALQPRIGRQTGRVVYRHTPVADFPQAAGDPNLQRFGPSRPDRVLIRGRYRQLLARILLEILWRRKRIDYESDDPLIEQAEPLLLRLLEGGEASLSPDSASSASPRLIAWLDAARQFRDELAARADGPQVQSSTLSETQAQAPNDPSAALDRLVRIAAADILNRAAVWLDRALTLEERSARVAFLWFDELWIEADPEERGLEAVLKIKMTAAAASERVDAQVAISQRSLARR